MAGTNPLGDVFNVAYLIGDSGYVNLKDASEVTFVCQLDAGDTFTVKEATSAAGAGAQNLSKPWVVNRAAKAGTGTWTTTVQSSGATVVTADGVAAVFTVRANQLSDGFTHIGVTSTSTGSVLAIVTGLKTRRAPANLPAVIA